MGRHEERSRWHFERFWIFASDYRDQSSYEREQRVREIPEEDQKYLKLPDRVCWATVRYLEPPEREAAFLARWSLGGTFIKYDQISKEMRECLCSIASLASHQSLFA